MKGDDLSQIKCLLDKGVDVNGSAEAERLFGGKKGLSRYTSNIPITLTPLIAAVSQKADVTVVALLLDRGARLDPFGYDRHPVLAAAIKFGADVSVIRLLLDRGAWVCLLACGNYPSCHYFVEDMEWKCLFFWLNGVGYSPLTDAIFCGADMDVLTLFLDQGANVNMYVIYYRVVVHIHINQTSQRINI